MNVHNALSILKQSTTELAALGLRSEAAVIARLARQVALAVEAGYSHRSIHQTIVAGGLTTSWTNYRVALGRARKAQRTVRRTEPVPVQASTPDASPEPSDATTPTPLGLSDASNSNPCTSTSSTTDVMNALRQARDVACSKDYGQIGRDLYRQQQRAQRNKRTTLKDPP
ncbi:hypothetical protein [Polaromonas sp.]|uniref:hypothetical protein n=1 Tax=Polaromonas sp. TaxID=1869339 RepID=UPI00352A6F7F